MACRKEARPDCHFKSQQNQESLQDKHVYCDSTGRVRCPYVRGTKDKLLSWQMGGRIGKGCCHGGGRGEGSKGCEVPAAWQVHNISIQGLDINEEGTTISHL